MEDAKDLIRRAFEAARRSGKADWQRMTIPVLKNRLLSLTNRDFNEAKYGTSSLRDFIRMAEPLVRIDDSVSPSIVELLDVPPGKPDETREAGAHENKPEQGQYARVRGDLWRAVLDYQSGRTFIWVRDANEAIVQAPGSTAHPDKLPTVTPDELTQWRSEFISATQVDDPSLTERLQRWKTERLPSTVLPSWLRGKWHALLKDNVEKRLRSWFHERRIEPPSDLLAISPGVRSQGPTAHLEALRRLVMSCVAEMTEREIAELRLPPAALLRATQRQKPSR